MIKYPNMLQPVKVGNMVLKNRLAASNSVMYFLQGGENFPTQQLITHVANKAKNGAAIVEVRGIGPRVGPRRVSADQGAVLHMAGFDLYDLKVQNYLSQMADAVHMYQSKICMNLACRIFPGYDVSEGLPPRPGQTEPSKELTKEMLYEIADEFAEQAKILKSLGYDMVAIHMAYRHLTPGRMLSPLLNHRTDEFGGSLENRARFPLLCCQKIKEACGKGFPVQLQISAEEDVNDPMAKYDTLGCSMVSEDDAVGFSLDDAIEFAKLAANGYVDILQLRGGLVDPSHPTGFTLEETPFLRYAEAVKKALPENCGMLIEAIGGFQYPETCEQALREGKADLIAMARTWISNSEYGRCVQEGRGDDIVPCIRCNKCHIAGFNDGWISSCSVNPVMGIEHRADQAVREPERVKNIAIIGGGPGGMASAITLHDRGHNVTIYEKTMQLGGRIAHSKFVDFKWPLQRYLNYLVHQVEKRGINTKLGVEATPEMIRAQGYDTVIAAVGADPLVLRIPGLEQVNYITAEDVFGREDTLGENVVVIGGGEVGVETSIHLARKGHKVKILEARSDLAMDSAPLHYRDMFKAQWENQEDLSWKTDVKVTRFEKDTVFYQDANGEEHAVAADNVVFAAGYKMNADLAMSFFGVADEFHMVGNCVIFGGLNKVNRSVWGTCQSI